MCTVCPRSGSPQRWGINVALKSEGGVLEEGLNGHGPLFALVLKRRKERVADDSLHKDITRHTVRFDT